MRVMLSAVILLATCVQCLVSARVGTVPGTWSDYDRKLKVFASRKPILVILFEFSYELELFKSYPSQQIISQPPRYLKRCPFGRIVVLSSLDHWEFWARKTLNFCRLCPLGTTFYATNDRRIHAFLESYFMPYIFPAEPMKKGLFYGVQFFPFIGKPRIDVSYPPSWTDEHLKKYASILNIIFKNVGPGRRYDFVLGVYNYTLESAQLEIVAPAGKHGSVYGRECPMIGAETPVVYSVYKPQALHVKQITDENFADDPSKVAALGIGAAVTLITWLSSPGRGFSHAVFVTAASLIAAIPLDFTKPGVKLILALGLWLFFGQIFTPIMKGELVKQASAGYEDKIRHVDACLFKQLEKAEGRLVGWYYSLPVYKKAASSQLLTYGAACFADVLDAQPFVTGFQMKYPKAEIYRIKHTATRNLQAADIPLISYDTDVSLFLRPTFGRAGVCLIRGTFYLQRLLRAGLFRGSRYAPYWERIHATRDEWLAARYGTPEADYSRHITKLEKIKKSSALGGSNIGACQQVLSVGWFVSCVVFVVTLAFGRRRAIVDRANRWLCSGFLRKPIRRPGMGTVSYDQISHKKMAKGSLPPHRDRMIFVRPTQRKSAARIS